jgi:hypothetical protein
MIRGLAVYPSPYPSASDLRVVAGGKPGKQCWQWYTPVVSMRSAGAQVIQ